MEFLQVEIPRTGSTSIRSKLGSQGQPRHQTALELREKFADYEDRWVFSLVRNPFSRLVSLWAQVDQDKTFEEFVQLRLLDRDWSRWEHMGYQERLFQPQWRYLCRPQGQIIVDYVGRFEQFEDSWLTIAEKVGSDTEIQQAASKSHVYGEDWKQHYTPRLKEVVRTHSAIDFDLFGYDRWK